MSDNSDYIQRSYYCSVCGTTHEISLPKKISEKQSKFPFSYFFLHGELKNILTTFYLDKHLEIRGVDVQKLTDDDIFSKDHVISITSTLVKEIEELRKENEELRLKLKKKMKKVK
jgi:hypothetical protein